VGFPCSTPTRLGRAPGSPTSRICWPWHRSSRGRRDRGGGDRRVLHDAIEDCHVSEAEIRARYGGPVAEIVVACSEKRPPGADWQTRKRDYLAHLEDPNLSTGALRVTSADKLHNARSILSDLREHGPSIWIGSTPARPPRPGTTARWRGSSVRAAPRRCSPGSCGAWWTRSSPRSSARSRRQGRPAGSAGGRRPWTSRR